MSNVRQTHYKRILIIFCTNFTKINKIKINRLFHMPFQYIESPKINGHKVSLQMFRLKSLLSVNPA